MPTADCVGVRPHATIPILGRHAMATAYAPRQARPDGASRMDQPSRRLEFEDDLSLRARTGRNRAALRARGCREPLQARKAPYQPPIKTDTTRSLPGARQALQLTSRGQSPCRADKTPGKSVVRAPWRRTGSRTSGGIERTGRTTTERAATLHGVLSRNLAHDPCTRKSNAAVGSQRNMSAFDEFYCRGKYHSA
jgi:hypothetical protein